MLRTEISGRKSFLVEWVYSLNHLVEYDQGLFLANAFCLDICLEGVRVGLRDYTQHIFIFI